MSGREFSPLTTLVVLLGASDWPSSPKLTSSPAFRQSAEDLLGYFTDPNGFNLPKDKLHLLNLFDFDGPPVELNRKLSEWLETAQQQAVQTGAPMRDLIVYYIGHGGFTPGGEQAYFLALRSTEDENEGISSLRMTDLARTLTKKARDLRRFIILDCCFAESAYELFQSEGGDPANAAHVKSLQDFPSKGTALLCSSSARDVSIAPTGEKHTMFSGSFLEVVRAGDVTLDSAFSLEHLGKRVARFIIEKYPEIAVRPKVSSPDEREGDIADLPVFPNAALSSRPVEQRLTYSEVQLERILDKLQLLDSLSRRLPAIEEKVAAFEKKPFQSRPTPPSSLSETSAIASSDDEPGREFADARVLRTAPPHIQVKVQQYLRARVSSVVWVAICILLSAYNGWIIVRISHGGSYLSFFELVRWTPFCPIIAILAIYSNGNFLLNVLTREKTSKKAASSRQETWESLPVVIAMRTNRSIPIFGTLAILTPAYEVGAILLLISTLALWLPSL
jgi:hypothetical protein